MLPEGFRIVHVSDLHFGREKPAIVTLLANNIRAAAPDLVIISGDFTQDGTVREFSRARQFLQELGLPYLCVPGNHDVPGVNLANRFVRPYHLYRKFIGGDTGFTFSAPDIRIAGINTARRILPHWNWAHGAVSQKQVQELQAFYAGGPDDFKICVMHHPIHKSVDTTFKTTVFGGAKALKQIQAMKVDLVLTGHVHHASITTMEEGGHRTVFLSASTACSTRIRVQENGYNVITLSREKMNIEIMSYREDGFYQLQAFEQLAVSPPS